MGISMDEHHRASAGGQGLLTDLYELTMMQACWRSGMQQMATFEFFVRELPSQRNFLVAAGLGPVLDYLRKLAFSPDELSWLASTEMFEPAFIDFLSGLRFSGDVHAVAEGTIVFAQEPILRIRAPLPQAQWVESRVMNLLHFSTLCASKAARCVLATRGKPLVDFGLRRAHGAEAAMLSARSSFIAGFSATSNVLAGMEYGIPVAGTMAHSFVQAHEHESDAFLAMASGSGKPTTLLIDTYDTESGARKAAAIHLALRRQGFAGIRAVRLDSGDLNQLSVITRSILDAAGAGEVKIVASGNLDEFQLQRLLASGAPIDEFGVGTSMNTSSDAPSLDCAYKLVEYAGRPCRKISPRKATWPGAKQVWRSYDKDDCMQRDRLALQGEPESGCPLLEMVVYRGEQVVPLPSLLLSQAHVRQQLAALPIPLRALGAAGIYPVEVSGGLQAMTATVDHDIVTHQREDALREPGFLVPQAALGPPQALVPAHLH